MNSEEYNQNPKICKQCTNILSFEKRRNMFCSSSCAATYNNTGRLISEQTRKSIASGIKAHNIAIGKIKKQKVKKSIRVFSEAEKAESANIANAIRDKSFANLEKDKWFLFQIENGRIAFNGTHFYNTKTNNIFESVNSAGYIQISLQEPVSKKICTMQEHRLVWIHANGLITDKTLVLNHKDGNKINNALSNLELVTVKENNQHARNIGLIVNAVKAENNGNAKFTNDEVRTYRKAVADGIITVKEISLIKNMPKSSVHSMISGKTYSSVV